MRRVHPAVLGFLNVPWGPHRAETKMTVVVARWLVTIADSAEGDTKPSSDNSYPAGTSTRGLSILQQTCLRLSDLEELSPPPTLKGGRKTHLLQRRALPAGFPASPRTSSQVKHVYAASSYLFFHPICGAENPPTLAAHIPGTSR